MFYFCRNRNFYSFISSFSYYENSILFTVFKLLVFIYSRKIVLFYVIKSRKILYVILYSFLHIYFKILWQEPIFTICHRVLIEYSSFIIITIINYCNSKVVLNNRIYLICVYLSNYNKKFLDF